MANYTLKAIMQNFEQMLEEMPFEKITVSALVSRCGISSNTFYYHYQDIYDLLDKWLISKHAQFSRDLTEQQWEDMFKDILHAMQDNSRLVYHVFDSISRERLERYIFNSIEGFFYEEFRRITDGQGLSDEAVRSISSFCCYAVLGFVLKFLWNHMEGDVDALVDGLSGTFSGVLDYVIRQNLPQAEKNEEASAGQSCPPVAR